MGNPNQAYFDEIENEAIQTLITGLDDGKITVEQYNMISQAVVKGCRKVKTPMDMFSIVNGLAELDQSEGLHLFAAFSLKHTRRLLLLAQAYR